MVQRYSLRPLIDTATSDSLRFAKLPPRQELIVRKALNARPKKLETDTSPCIEASMRVYKIDSTAKTPRWLSEVHKEGRVTEALAASDHR